ncbi:MAG: hypothetical protein Q7J59_04795 [Elusimicrobiota bacterium]|nr:hypothetical protein [Elusimicrobiota bacterium]
MYIDALKRQLERRVNPVYVFIGADDGCKEEGFGLICKALGPSSIIRTDPAFPPGDILTELNSQLLFSDKKIVLIKDAEGFKNEELTAILAYSKNSTTVLVIFCAWNARLKKFFTSPDIVVVDCFKPFPWKTAAAVRARLAKEGKKIDDAAMSALIEISRNSSVDIDLNVSKLLTFKADDAVVTQDDVERISTSRETDSIFEFTWQMIGGDAVSLLQKAEQLKSDGEMGCLGYARGLFEKFLTLKQKIREGQPVNINDAKALGIFDKNQQEAAVRIVSSTPEKKILEAYKTILETFEKYKSGQPGAFANAAVKISGFFGKGAEA